MVSDLVFKKLTSLRAILFHPPLIEMTVSEICLQVKSHAGVSNFWLRTSQKHDESSLPRLSFSISSITPDPLAPLSVSIR